MSDEKPAWRKAIEDYERSIGAPLEEFIKSDQFADMAAQAAKDQTQTPPLPPGLGGVNTTEWLHSMNLPAASDIDDLRTEIQALRDDVRALTEALKPAPEATKPEATKPKATKPKPKPASKAAAKPKPKPVAPKPE